MSKDLKIKEELAMKWLHDGAKPTETVKILFKKFKLNEKYDNSKRKTK
jgi:small subunit ribosomal protein S16